MPVYDLQALGCVLDGNPANAAPNTAIFLKAEQDARGGNPGPIEVGMGAGLAVLNSKLELKGANMVLRGHGGMGTVSNWGATSLIRGFGPGDILKVSQGGCRVSGLAWQGSGQGANDCFLKVTETQVEVFDHHMDSPNIGISVVAAPGSLIGQSWLRNILMEGLIRYAGVDISNGGGATKLDHVRMFNGSMDDSSPQPKYGVLVRSAGEFIMCGGCDLDNCGVPLAIVPGIDGQANTYVQNVDISDCDFDNGNGDGQILIRPEGSSFIINAQIANGWCSSVHNGLQPNGSTWPGNGMTIDGRRARPAAGFPAICNVGVMNSVFQNAVGHCGLYANAVTGLSIIGCGAWSNFVGFQTYACSGAISGVKAGNYAPTALGAKFAGNATYGVVLEKSLMAFNPNDNALAGNGVGPFRVIP